MGRFQTKPVAATKTVEAKPAGKRFALKPSTPAKEEKVVKAKDITEFKTAVRQALTVCPRRPNAVICGYGGVDSKGKKYDTCLLPSGHSGPHMSVDLPEIPAKVERQVVMSSEIEFDFYNEAIPRELTDILYAWRKIGNPWASCLEADLECFSKGIVFESKIDNLAAVRTLHYLGFMDKQEPGVHETMAPIRYRLSKKGIAATNTIAKLIGDQDASTITLSAGTEPTKKGRVSSPEKAAPVAKSKPTKNHWPLKGTKEVVEVDCERCDGEGVVGIKKAGKIVSIDCPDCDGTGKVEAKPVAPKRKFAVKSK